MAYGIRDFKKLLNFAPEAIHSIAAGSAVRAQMQRFIKKSAFDNGFRKSGYDVDLAATLNQ